MEIIKEFFGAIGERLRSHFIGSILISFLAFNWDSVLFLMLDGNSVWVKISYIKQNWEYWRPLSFGLLIGFLNPWVVFGGAILARYPSEKLYSLQDDTKHKRTMKILENEAIENDKKAELAKSKDDALKSIDDEDIRDRLKEETAPSKSIENSNQPNTFSPQEVYKYWEILSPLERNIIKRMGKRMGILLTIVQDAQETSLVQIDGQAAPKASIREYEQSMNTLQAYGIAENKIPHSNKVSVFELTDAGYSFSQQIPTSPAEA